MYATAHLVRSSAGDEGINAFLHLHGPDFPWPQDAAVLADTEPGKVILRHIEVPPGFNLVAAYLDVLAPDGTPREEIAGALAAVRQDLGERLAPTVFVHGRVTIRFGVELRLHVVRAQQLDMLASVALALLAEL